MALGPGVVVVCDVPVWMLLLEEAGAEAVDEDNSKLRTEGSVVVLAPISAFRRPRRLFELVSPLRRERSILFDRCIAGSAKLTMARRSSGTGFQSEDVK